MITALITILLVVVFPTQVFAQTQSPVYPADPYGSRPLAQGKEARLRIVLLGEESSVERQIRLGSISVCSDSACYQAPSQQYFDLEVSGKGGGRIVADIVVPIATISRVSFEPLGGDKIVEGRVTLQNPFQFTKDVPAAELLVVLKKKILTGKTSFEPAFATASHFSEPRTSIYYNPKFESRVQLDHGVSLFIPPNATAHPQIFSVAIHDTGEQYPLVDIFPELKLRSAAELTLSRFARQPRPVRSDQSQDTPKPGAPGVLQRNDDQRDGPRTVRIERTGVVRNGVVGIKDEVELPSVRSMAANASVWWSNCPQVLLNPQSEPTFAQLLPVTGTIQLIGARRYRRTCTSPLQTCEILGQSSQYLRSRKFGLATSFTPHCAVSRIGRRTLRYS
jgi:hypothetical protein